jgi:hypothetical protein
MDDCKTDSKQPSFDRSECAKIGVLVLQANPARSLLIAVWRVRWTLMPPDVGQTRVYLVDLNSVVIELLATRRADIFGAKTHSPLLNSRIILRYSLC